MNNKMESALSQTVISENALQKGKTDEIPQNRMGEKRHMSYPLQGEKELWIQEGLLLAI